VENITRAKRAALWREKKKRNEKRETFVLSRVFTLINVIVERKIIRINRR